MSPSQSCGTKSAQRGPAHRCLTLRLASWPATVEDFYWVHARSRRSTSITSGEGCSASGADTRPPLLVALMVPRIDYQVVLARRNIKPLKVVGYVDDDCPNKSCALCEIVFACAGIWAEKLSFGLLGIYEVCLFSKPKELADRARTYPGFAKAWFVRTLAHKSPQKLRALHPVLACD